MVKVSTSVREGRTDDRTPTVAEGGGLTKAQIIIRLTLPPNLLRHIFNHREQRRERPARSDCVPTDERLGPREASVGPEGGFGGLVGEVDDEVAWEGVEAAGGDHDGAGLAREVVEAVCCVWEG